MSLTNNALISSPRSAGRGCRAATGEGIFNASYKILVLMSISATSPRPSPPLRGGEGDVFSAVLFVKDIIPINAYSTLTGSCYGLMLLVRVCRGGNSSALSWVPGRPGGSIDESFEPRRRSSDGL